MSVPSGNSAIWEESTMIVLDTETEAGAIGWTPSYVSVNRIGNLVAVHIEAAFAHNAAGLVCTLQNDFAPAATVTSSDGKFTIGANGQVTYTASTAAGAGSAVLDINYQAALTSP